MVWRTQGDCQPHRGAHSLSGTDRRPDRASFDPVAELTNGVPCAPPTSRSGCVGTAGGVAAARSARPQAWRRVSGRSHDSLVERGRPFSCESYRRLSTAAAAQVAEQPAVYSIDIVTGDVRFAGSQVPAEIELVGTDGRSDPITVGGDETGFARGATDSMEVHLPAPVGDLKRVVVRQTACPVDSEGGPDGWFLDRVVIRGPGGEQWTFPCGAWIGKSEHTGNVGDAETERNLIQLDESVEAVEYLAEPLQVAVSAVSVPLAEKVQRGKRAVNRKGFGYGGEDAYYYAWGPSNGLFGLGVADGVYMWAKLGIDSGEFSRALMDTAKRATEGGTADVLNVLQASAATVADAGIEGSSTCCVVLVDTLQGRLTSANIGDSGFIVVGTTVKRGDLHIKYRSPQQEHQFGYPYQLGHMETADHPQDAMLTHISVMPGDICILGSDGLFDNVSEEEMLEEVRKMRETGAGPNAIARQLTKVAFYNSLDKGKVTPYSVGATEAFDMVYNGGKEDDITVVVARFEGEFVTGGERGLGRHGL